MGRLWIGLLASVTIWGLVVLVFAEDPNPRSNPAPSDPVTSCSAGVKTIGETVPCLRNTLDQEEARLSKLEAKNESQAKEIEAHWPRLPIRKSLKKSTANWKQYRDHECDRREKFRAGGNHPDITRYDCLIEKTRERAQDLRFND